MKLKLLTYLISVSIIFLTACNKESSPDCFKSAGSKVTIERIVSNFNAIEVKGKLDVIFVSGNENKISITGGKNLLPKILTEINDNKLTIDNENKCNFVRSYKKSKIVLEVQVNNLEHLNINGLGHVSSKDTIFSDNLKIEFTTGISDLNLKLRTKYLELVVHDGGGDISLSGTSENTNIFSNGYAKLDMGNFISNYIFLASKSQNQTFIYANNRIDVEIYDVGNVYYSGNPVISLSTFSSGKLIKLD